MSVAEDDNVIRTSFSLILGPEMDIETVLAISRNSRRVEQVSKLVHCEGMALAVYKWWNFLVLEQLPKFAYLMQ